MASRAAAPAAAHRDQQATLQQDLPAPAPALTARSTASTPPPPEAVPPPPPSPFARSPPWRRSSAAATGNRRRHPAFPEAAAAEGGRDTGSDPSGPSSRPRPQQQQPTTPPPCPPTSKRTKAKRIHPRPKGLERNGIFSPKPPTNPQRISPAADVIDRHGDEPFLLKNHPAWGID
ncbi:Os08g0162300 [Oryza sativa Japonica Group]|uniref:Os08g0162300 protein n=1 Tax=Oryza sativa subsp. japonica TaxID=39947 RepID=A0A0P0XC89_ORYSJ|nr:hypothetical protein EE612_042277 [Oryza sativa]BAT03952.1 Os08g0162300 [Oryza sativa Japonica Group]